MAILRCNKCGHLREVPNQHLGKTVSCPNCKKATSINDTVAFVESLIANFLKQRQELKLLKQQLNPPATESEMADTNHQSLADLDLYNTTLLASSQQYEPIVDWFKKRNTQLEVNQHAVDTTGFFDEIAVQLGDNFEVLKLVTNQIKYVQNKGYDNVKVVLGNRSSSEIALITRFCQEMYDYSFVAKYFYQKKDKLIRLTLQTSTPIVRFFNGEWMEWYVFMKVLEMFRRKSHSVAILRNLSITFADGSKNELDVFFLINNTIPVCIECKTGEFREDIKKYTTLRKKLGLDKEQFVLSVLGLSQQQTQGLSSMHDVTFTNAQNLFPYLEQLVAKETGN